MIPTSATSRRSSTAAIGSRVPGRHRGVVEVADRERQHPEALLRQLLVGGEEFVAHVGDRRLLAVPERLGCTGRSRRPAHP